MTRKLLALALLAFVTQAQAGANWSSLWRNADQRGEALLQHGDAAAAAREYRDPRRKAYAELKAGDYAAAARDYAALDDGDAAYNRGNALAHAGDLQGALDAYDAALKHDPRNRDARHNRELVANALKQQPPQQQAAGGDKPRDGKQGGGKNDRQDQASANSPTQAKPGQSGQQGNGHADADQSAAPDTPGNAPARQGQGGQNPAPAAQSTPAQGRDDAEQARRDAAASLAQAKAGGKDGADSRVNADGIDAKSATAPLSERQLAREQWLRAIPDDPGGLLRRKFLIEHMLRQQKTPP